jgi:glutathione S-transferase
VGQLLAHVGQELLPHQLGDPHGVVLVGDHVVGVVLRAFGEAGDDGIDELADTVADQAVVAWQTHARGDKVGEERAFGLAKKALAELDQRAREGRWPAAFGLADAAVIGALGYFEIRHGRALLEEHPALLARVSAQAARPSVASTVPQA